MDIKKYLKRMVPWSSNLAMTEGPTFRCLRCGAEFECEYSTCPDCNGQFVGEVEDE